MLRGDRVTDSRLTHILHTSNQIAHLTRANLLGLDRLWADHTDLEHLVHGASGHHLDAIAMAELAVNNPHIGDYTSIGVIDRVEDQRSWRSSGISYWRGGLLDNLVEHCGHTDASLGTDLEHLGLIAPDDAGQLRGVLVGIGVG